MIETGQRQIDRASPALPNPGEQRVSSHSLLSPYSHSFVMDSWICSEVAAQLKGPDDFDEEYILKEHEQLDMQDIVASGT